MAIFALSDLHLSLSNPEKSMTVFGPKWDDYIERIRESWTASVTEEDTVLVSGDISWATKIEDATEDFEFIASLPGTKLLSRGNHDFWWTTISKMDEFFAGHDYHGIKIVRTNVIEVEDCLISGTRGWMLPTDSEFKQQDQKIYEREQARLKLCFDEMDKKDPDRTKKRIIMLHYPPITKYNHPTAFTDIIREGGADICVHGHLHGRAHEIVYTSEIFENCRYLCTSGDYLGFTPLKVL
jgi:hypothetical protein